MLAMDGTTLRTADSVANRTRFGAQGYAGRTVASYPQVRSVTVTSIPTHLVVDATFDPYKINKMRFVACYSRRGQIETSYRELKQSMMGMALTLLSKTVDGVMQEIWSALTAYNLIRLEIAKAALEAKCAPTDISFIRAFHTIHSGASTNA